MAVWLYPTQSPGLTLYSFIFPAQAATVWNGMAFVTFEDADWATYAITTTEIGSTGVYEVPIPSETAFVAGDYDVQIYSQSGVTPAVGDFANGGGEVTWVGPPSPPPPPGPPSFSGASSGEILLESDNDIWLVGVTNEGTGEFLNAATVTYAICPQGSSTPITGGTGTLTATGTDGNYLGIIDAAIVTPGPTNNVVDQALYNMKWTLVQGNYNRVWMDTVVMVYGG